MIKTKSIQAFTLIELSIVLVIIGLVVGGVLVGKDLIYEANVKRMLSDVEKYKTAINTFRLKYNCLPGDCNNAYQFFGATCGTNNTSLVQGGCNGDGDTKIGSFTIFNAFIGDSINESIKFWTHLNMAGFGPATTGTYSTNPRFQVGVNVPQSSFTGVGFSIVTWHWNNRNPLWGDENNIIFGSNNPSSDNLYVPAGPVFTPAQVLAIDQKVDDGLSYSGTLTGFGAYASPALADCVTAAPAYNVSATDNGCYIAFFKAW